MVAVIIILLVLFALAMIWLGVDIQMVESELYVWVKVMFLRVQAYPRPKKSSAKAQNKDEKSAKTNKKPKKSKSKMDYKGLVRLILKAAGRLRRKIGVKKLIFNYTAGGIDPADTALQYGRVSGAVYGMLPEVCRIFNVKHKDVSVNIDFDITKPKIEFEVSVGLYAWQLLHLGVNTLIDFMKLQKNSN